MLITPFLSPQPAGALIVVVVVVVVGGCSLEEFVITAAHSSISRQSAAHTWSPPSPPPLWGDGSGCSHQSGRNTTTLHGYIHETGIGQLIARALSPGTRKFEG